MTLSEPIEKRRSAVRRKLLGNRHINELIQGNALRLRQLLSLFHERRLQPESEVAVPHLTILSNAARGVITSMPNLFAAGLKCLRLKLTIALACPCTAVSSTNSSAGSLNCGRIRVVRCTP